MDIGEIYYLNTDFMFQQQSGNKWLKITASPRSAHTLTPDSGRPFLYLKDGHTSEWALMVPITNTGNRHSIKIPEEKIAEAGLQRNSKIMREEVWEIPKELIHSCERNALPNGTHKILNQEFVQTDVMRQINNAIQKILESY